MNLHEGASDTPRIWFAGGRLFLERADHSYDTVQIKPHVYAGGFAVFLPADAVELAPPVAPPLSEWARGMRSVLGSWVEVTLQDDPKVTQQGVLHDFTDDGQVRLRDDTGAFHWCWPNLACVKAERPLGT